MGLRELLLWLYDHGALLVIVLAVPPAVTMFFLVWNSLTPKSSRKRIAAQFRTHRRRLPTGSRRSRHAEGSRSTEPLIPRADRQDRRAA